MPSTNIQYLITVKNASHLSNAVIKQCTLPYDIEERVTPLKVMSSANVLDVMTVKNGSRLTNDVHTNVRYLMILKNASSLPK